MTIRAKLTLWYFGVLCFSALLIGGLIYYKFAAEKHHDAVRREAHKHHQSQPEAGGMTNQAGVISPSHHGEKEKEGAEEADLEPEEIASVVFWCGIPAVGLALAGGWWLMRKALAPVTAITLAAEKIHERNLSERLPRTGNGDELDRLTEVFNAMTARLHDSFTRIREFTLHASHELKTPLTILRGETETELADESLMPDQRERAISRLEEYHRLSRIVSGLTLLAKADAGQIKLAKEPVRLDELVRDVFADAQILAQSSDLELKLAACEHATVNGDRNRLRQLLLNLVDNAVKYNVAQGRITMGLLHAHDGIEFVITNTGFGIPPEVLPRVFDRFFRGDPAHSSDIEGCGLGLSIAQWIATAHDGQIKIVSEPNKETTITVHLPLSEEAKLA